jgi:hypothetical protein
MKQLYVMTLGLLLLMIAVVPATAQPQYPNGYGQQQNWRGALSPDDQQKFDHEYAKWADSQRKNDRDDIAESARHMQDIMTRNNIPSNVPFDQIASNAAPGYPPYPNTADPNASYPAYSQTRLSNDDQRKFDEDYAKWVDSQRKNDQDDIVKAADKMREIMSRAGIPSNVPFAAIATNGYLAGPNAPPYGYTQAAAPQRLSSKDQEEFDKSFRHWVDARHKKDMDDVDKNARKMQEIMSRYNIPANVPFDRIATEGSAYR